MATNDDIRKDRDEAYDQAIKYWGNAIQAMKEDVKFALGDQWDAADKSYLKKQRREALVFNKTHRILKIITGFQRKNRLALKYDPVDGGDSMAASQATKLAMQLMAQNDGYNLMSDAFEKGALMAGINLVGLHVDYNDDMLNGDIKMTRWPYNAFILDPNFTKPDLTDCAYVLTRQYVGKKALKTMIPTSKMSMLKDLEPRGTDEKFPNLTTTQNMKGKYDYRYDEFWMQDTETYKILINIKTKQSQIWTEGEEKLRILMQNFPNLRLIRRTRRTVKCYVFVEDKLVYSGNPWGIDEFPFVPVMGFFTPEADSAKLKIQGVVRLIRDPATEMNKRKSKMLDIMDSVISSGWRAKQSSVVDPKALYISGQGKVIWIKDGYDMEDVQPIQSSRVPEGLFRLQEIFDKDIVEIPGANDDLLGTPEGDDQNVAGILAKLRQSSGITILQDLYDNYRKSKKLLGSKMLKMAQANYDARKISRIIGERVVPQLLDKDFGRYDCIPTEGILTDTQRQMYFTQLIALKQMGAPIPWTEIMGAAPVEGKDRLVNLVKQAEKAQAKEAQDMNQMNQIFNALNMAKAEEEIAGAKDKRAEALLERVRAIKELNEIDLSKIKELLEVALKIEETKNPKITKR